MAKPQAMIIGNWKMFGTAPMLAELAVMAAAIPAHVTMGICPPFTLIQRAAQIATGSRLLIGAQDVHPAEKGAHTGCISVAMLRDAGAQLVIVGHSERRADNFESNAMVKAKAQAALAGDLRTILCVGETAAERDAGNTLEVITAQLSGSLPDTLPAGDAALVIAYEPVWAIGTGRIPSAEDVCEVHAHIRAALQARYGQQGGAIAILYGGSVNPGNAALLLNLPEVGGALVGGASLTAESFLAIAAAV